MPSLLCGKPFGSYRFCWGRCFRLVVWMLEVLRRGLKAGRGVAAELCAFVRALVGAGCCLHIDTKYTGSNGYGTHLTEIHVGLVAWFSFSGVRWGGYSTLK